MRCGVTLVELLVAIALLALASTGVVMSWRSGRPTDAASVVAAMEEARARAIWTGRPARWAGHGTVVRFQADGSATPAVVAVGRALLTVDALSGEVRAIR
jgi:prepilin-type N-terminal cleavage/methylation domain-containing protein